MMFLEFGVMKVVRALLNDNLFLIPRRGVWLFVTKPLLNQAFLPRLLHEQEKLELIRRLIQKGQILVSEHGYDDLAADDIFIKDVLAGINEGIIVEERNEKEA